MEHLRDIARWRARWDVMSDLRNEIATETRVKACAFVAALGTPIELLVAPCADYSSLLRGNFDAPAKLGELLVWATRRGRVMVSGRGASGKSAVLHRVAVLAADTAIVPFVMHLSKWDQAASADWGFVRENPREAMDFLMRRFGLTGRDIADAEFLPSAVPKLFLLDGLNETPGHIADEIVQVADQIAALLVGASVILTDRLVRRNLTEAKWRYATPLPVDKAEVERLIHGLEIPAGAETLLPSPFFLDRAIRGELKASPLATIRELFEDRGRLDANGLGVAAVIAFTAYERDRSRTFPRARFLELGHADVLETLCVGGLLVSIDDTRVAFFHHWYHDYLASKHVAERPELWNFENRHRVLDILTFRANSFDAIGFALELLPVAESGAFLQAVYDWNPYAAGYALAEAGIREDDVPLDVRVIMFAMLAERRFDRHFHSARRAADALELQRDEIAVRMRSARDLEQLFEVIASVGSLGERFRHWRALFTAREATGEMICALSSEDSVVGWTSANVLRRLPLARDQLATINAAVTHPRPVVRWRVVHVMGGFATDEFVTSLFGSLEDIDENVSYGAMRSLVEVASRDEVRLPRIVDRIIDRLHVIEANPRVLGELERAVFLASGVAPPTWDSEISRIFYELLERADDPSANERWSKLASRLRVHHRLVTTMEAP
jgi:hypothetical protein